MTTTTDLDQARAAFARREWLAAASAYAAADHAVALEARDLGQAGLATHLCGDDEGAARLMARAHHLALDQGDPTFAAYIAFWLGMMLANRGEHAVAGGWLARSSRVVEEHRLDSVVNGYLLVPRALQALDAGDAEAAFGLFEQAAACADRFGEADLATMARLGRGQSLIMLGEISRGVALLDDAMLTVMSGGVSPVVTGIVYCAAIEAFHGLYDVRRAQGWTEALTRWRDEQPELVPFRGRCLVFRAELMRFHGDWPSATVEVQLAEESLLRPPPEPAAGEAFYLQAELCRLRGEFDAAEAAYREASGWGRRAEPGLALLRLAQGRVAAARAMLDAHSTKRRPGSAGRHCSTCSSRSRSRTRAWTPPVRPSTSWTGSPGSRRRRCSTRSPRPRTALSAWRAASRWARWRPIAARRTCGRRSTRRMSRPGSARGSGRRVGRSVTRRAR